ncbi:MAG TPA: calcium-binding protein [Solirubrobacterales bacterium]|nr:calcium-binding protein [Solirubrobacterales bacterium]
MRLLTPFLAACLVMVLSLVGEAAADTTPTCAEGPTTVGDTTYGTPCADVIVAPASVEAVKGGGGDDTIIAPVVTAATDCPGGCFLGIGSQTFEGGPGNDVVYGERGNDILRGGEGDDQLFGGIGDDLLQGGPGNDRLGGGFGADSIDGEEGDDYVRGDSTIDRIFDTGGGTDTLSYSTGVTPGWGDAAAENGVKLELGTIGENARNGVAPNGGGVDEVETGVFETIVGTAFADRIVGTGAAETIYGGGGADVIEGGGGGDQIFGGADGDVCVAPGGTTAECEGAVATRNTGKVSVGFITPPGATPYAQLYLVGSSGDDSVTATYSTAAVSFGLTSGSFDASVADDGGCEVKSATEAVCPLGAMTLDSLMVAGLGGADTIAVNGFPASTGILLTGGEGGDSLGGRDGDDILVDGQGEGQDVLNALGGDDALTHNGGPDQLNGGDGNDLFLSNSVCDGEAVVGGGGRDNASWARFGEGVAANLETHLAGRPSGGPTPACGAEPLDSLSEIEDLEGSAFEDDFYGDAGANQLLGHPGADAYFAGAGEDSILANSGDADRVIDCGADNDVATIDRPKFGDPAPVECEAVYEADPNDFRLRTLLPPPPLVEPAPVPPPKPARDARPPRTRIVVGPPSRIVSARKWRRVAFRFNSNEPGSSFRCKLDAKPYRACGSPRAYRVKAGRHVFRVYAIDPAGNRDATPAAFRFRLRRR